MKNTVVMFEEGWGPMVKLDENPYIAPGEPEPPTEPTKKIDDFGEGKE